MPGVPSTAANESPVADERPEFCLLRIWGTVRAMPLRIAAASILVLIPCFWQPHVGSGDFPSHVYNAWLVQQIKQGHAPGLWIAPQSTNVLFDLMLDWLIGKVGLGAAQRIAVSVSVCVFFWGAFGLVAAITRKVPWFATPLLAILSYGTIYNGGMFNYYLAVGFSLAALAVLWRATVWDGIVAALFLALGWLGQPVPVVWALAVFGYVFAARRVTDRVRLWFLLVCVALLLGVRHFILAHWKGIWYWRQMIYANGAGQSFPLGHHYRVVTVGVWLISIAVLLHLVRTLGLKGMLTSIPVQIYLLCVLVPALLPETIYFPSFKAFAASGLARNIVFGAINYRLGWFAGVLLCPLLAQVKNPVWYARAAATVALIYFILLYQDHGALNKLEERVEEVVSTLPANSSVIARLSYPPVDGSDQGSFLDRACIGRCISFDNYEPATWEFRVRANPGNSIVAWSVDSPDHFYSRSKEFFFTQPNGILYYLYQCGSGLKDVCVRSITRDDVATLKD